eukprot:symbB.v1.2.027003.t1/scaffold2737.1/size71945/1
MGKSKEQHHKAVANLQALQDLAKKLHEEKEKDAKSAATESEAVPGADHDPPPAVPVKRRKSRKSPEEGPAEPNAKEAVAEPSKKSRKADKEDAKISKGKSSDNLQLSEKTMFDAENFNPTALPFCLGWENFGKLKDFYKMSDAETTSILLAMCGPSPDGKIYWSKYKLPKQYQDVVDGQSKSDDQNPEDLSNKKRKSGEQSEKSKADDDKKRKLDEQKAAAKLAQEEELRKLAEKQLAEKKAAAAKLAQEEEEKKMLAEKQLSDEKAAKLAQEEEEKKMLAEKQLAEENAAKLAQEEKKLADEKAAAKLALQEKKKLAEIQEEKDRRLAEQQARDAATKAEKKNDLRLKLLGHIAEEEPDVDSDDEGGEEEFMDGVNGFVSDPEIDSEEEEAMPHKIRPSSASGVKRTTPPELDDTWFNLF